jgi:transcriptional regulator with XRE-family HTH domain
MGRGTRPRPARLGEKLVQIRKGLGLSQNGMLRHLGITEGLIREDISEFERGRREPPLPVLLKYARAAGVCLDILVDDEADLPKKLPGIAKHKGK